MVRNQTGRGPVSRWIVSGHPGLLDEYQEQGGRHEDIDRYPPPGDNASEEQDRRIEVEQVEMQERDDRCERREDEDSGDRHPRVNPPLLASGQPLECHTRPVTGSEEGRHQRDADRPREEAVRGGAQDEELDAGQEHEGFRQR
jgi:hypothetical protein